MEPIFIVNTELMNSLSKKILVNWEQIEKFCSKWKIVEFGFFGSFVTPNFNPTSDIDIMVLYENGITWSLINVVDMKDELEFIFHRKIDYVNKKGIELSQNERRRNAILGSYRVVYERKR